MSKRINILSILFVLMLYASPASAQEDQTLATVEVDLWPEFDKPSMLVIHSITLPPDTSFPLEMEFLIPTEAGVPNAVAGMQPDGILIDLNYEQIPGEQYSRILFTAPTPIIQIEYYDPNLTREGALRSYEYRWPGGYPVERFIIEVQQPAGAENMRISPSLGSGSEYSDGLTYYSSNLGSLQLGQSFAISLEYEKDSDDLTAPSMPVEASGPIGESPAGELELRRLLPLILGGLGLLLIVGGGFWYWQSGRERPQAQPVPRRRKKSTPMEGETTQGGHVYCHQCGKRASNGDRFCRACGTQLRRH